MVVSWTGMDQNTLHCLTFLHLWFMLLDSLTCSCIPYIVDVQHDDLSSWGVVICHSAGVLSLDCCASGFPALMNNCSYIRMASHLQ